jgi:hypothetical protein
MKELRYTLLSDGPSDRALLPILTWLLREQGVDYAIQPDWADLRRLPSPPRTLGPRIKIGLELYPCDLLFVHRDAERFPHQTRVNEIRREVAEIAEIAAIPPVVCVVPVRMQEAWLLFSEAALRRASGNPNGRQPMRLPSLYELESIPDPKRLLNDLLREVSGLNSRRRQKFQVSISAKRVSELIDDFTPLRVLPAFSALEEEIKQIIRVHNWG